MILGLMVEEEALLLKIEVPINGQSQSLFIPPEATFRVGD
jgi:hypothetical protein